MKKTGLAAAAALLIATIPSTASAQAGSPGANREYIEAVQEFCAEIIESGSLPGLNSGECISFNVASEGGFISHFCDALREGAFGGLGGWGFADYDDCVRNLEL